MREETSQFCGKAFAALTLCIAASTSATANSPLITSYFGEWRAENDGACADDQNKPHLGFSFDGEEFVEFGNAKCKLTGFWGDGFKVKDFEECARTGFPKEMIGKYELVVSGHIKFTGQDLETEMLTDCRGHR
jgi:hypothetical protein